MYSCPSPPLFSIGSDKGRRSEMEDTHDVRLDFMELPLDSNDLSNVIPPQLMQLLHASNGRESQVLSTSFSAMARCHSTADSSGPVNKVEMFHLFSVFDGHGGHGAAEHCANTLAQNLKTQITRTLKKHALPIQEIVRHHTVPTHVLLAEAITLKDLSDSEEESSNATTAAVPPIKTMNSAFADAPSPPIPISDDEEEDVDETDSDPQELSLFSTMSLGITARSQFNSQSRLIHSLVSQGLESFDFETSGLTASQLVACFNDAFVATDNQFDRGRGADESGTTALTAMISPSILCFAHCGDCRGVLYRGDETFQVTREHSPESPDEKQRVELLGGHIMTIRADTPRVMGVLAMTRSIGDFGLRPYIIPNPEVTIIKRSKCDSFLVLASDGLWGFLTNQEVCELVNKCFDRVESKGIGRHMASKVASNLLIKKAIESGSPDNITVIVIDLRQYY